MQEHGRYGMVQHSAAGVRRLAEDNLQAVHMGAADFVLKPWDNEKMLATI